MKYGWAVVALGAVVTGLTLSQQGTASAGPQRQYITVEVASGGGAGGLSATWKIGARPSEQNGAQDGEWVAFKGWLPRGTLVQATSTISSPIPPWLGPTQGWASCTIYGSWAPRVDRFLGGDGLGTILSTSYYRAPTIDAIWGTPASCRYRVGQ